MRGEIDYDVFDKGAGAAQCFVQFFKHPVKDEAASLEAGRPVFKDTDYVRIMTPGDKTSMPERPVREQDRQEYRRAWQAYQQNQSAPMEGTPLKEWPGITRAQVEELAYFNVHTVEQLASISDGNAQNMGPVLALRQRARDYIERAKSEAPAQALRAQLDEANSQRDAMKRQLDEMSAKLDGLLKKKG